MLDAVLVGGVGAVPGSETPCSPKVDDVKNQISAAGAIATTEHPHPTPGHLLDCRRGSLSWQKTARALPSSW